MRLKKINAGSRILKFINPYSDPVTVFCKKEPFVHVRANSHMIIESSFFLPAFPMAAFPELDLYASKKIYVVEFI